jgi:predicted transposase/invertase (TIGR01784 family)
MPYPTPHDELFKATFSIASQAAAFLQTWLPEEISEKLDLSTLQRDPDTYVDEQLQEHLMDMVYTCKWKNSHETVKVSFLFEHKSRVSPRLYFQLLRYLSNIYDKLSEKSEKPGPVVPIVIYHGKAKWEKRDLPAHFTLPEPSLCRFLPLFDYLFHDLRDISDSILVSQQAGYLLRRAFLLMKYQHRPEEFEKKEMTEKIFIFTVEEKTSLSQDEMLSQKTWQSVSPVPLDPGKGKGRTSGPPFAQKSLPRCGLAKPNRSGEGIYSCAGRSPAQLSQSGHSPRVF